MKRSIKIILIIIAVLATVAVLAAGWLFSKAAPIASGFVAKYLCSSTFISDRDPAIVFEEDVKPVNPLASIVSYSIDRRRQTVTASSLGLFTMTALYRDGCGCSLVIDTTADEMTRQKLVPPDFADKRPRQRADLPWPDGSRGPVDPVDLGVDRQKLETAPGAKWYYSSGTTNIVAGIVRRAIERDHEYYYRYIHEELFDRIGMYSAVMEPDSSGTFAGSSYTFATPRDWARFGLFYLQDGIWQGRRILPAGWVAYTTTPTPAAPRGEYGAHAWLNAGSAANPQDRRWPAAPRDAFAALGFQEQKVIVIPSRKLVLVRFGATSERQAWNTNEFIQNVLASLP